MSPIDKYDFINHENAVTGFLTCPDCLGQGEVPDGDMLPTQGGFANPNQETKECPYCEGQGVIA